MNLPNNLKREGEERDAQRGFRKFQHNTVNLESNVYAYVCENS